MQVDYIIVGQGLCGSFLSWNLMKAGKKVLVIDESKPNSSSKVASGVINPITGRRLVRTWDIETLLPYSLQAYTEFGKDLHQQLVQQCSILDFLPTPQMELAFKQRLNEEPDYLHVPNNENDWKNYFNYPFSIGEINPCLLVDLNSLITIWRKKLLEQNALLARRFEWKDCVVSNDSISFQGIIAEKIIYCDGAAGINNPYFKLLPYAANKGEAIIASIENLPRNHIYKQGIVLVPWKEDLWWIGSTYEWNYSDLNPTEKFKQKVVAELNQWLQLPYQIVDHIASERPANMERKPFLGLHPIKKNIGIFNGMGTKGCSLAPYYATELTNHLLYQTPINPLADVQRFKNVLSR
jgi:glycine/D-amino acid oxidase-like deaminating enzyme